MSIKRGREDFVKKTKSPLIYGFATLALSAWAGQIAAQEESDEKDDDLEVIEVTGIRASLNRALAIKRDATGIVDAISAEDIGSFPDENIAESLQRISGVTLERQQGEGSRISIRGLGPNLNLTLLNEQQIASSPLFVEEQPSRSFNFALLASEVISSAEVYKSPEAWFDEGGVGGTVILRTLKPLDLDKPLLSVRVEGGYSELADEFDPRFTVTAGAKSKNGKWGGILSLVDTDRSIRSDFTGPNTAFAPRALDIGSDGILDFGVVPLGTNDPTRGFGEDPNNSVQIQGVDVFDEAGNLIGIGGVQSLDPVFQPNFIISQLEIGERERTGGSGAIQFRPNDRWEFTLNGLYSELTEVSERNTSALLAFVEANSGLGVTVTPVNDAVIVNNTLVAGTIPTRITDNANFTGLRGQTITTELSSFTRDSQSDTYAVDLESKYTSSDGKWEVISHLGRTEATTDSNSRTLATITVDSQIQFDLRTGENGFSAAPRVTNLGELQNNNTQGTGPFNLDPDGQLNPAGQGFSFANFQDVDFVQDQDYFSLDTKYFLEHDIFSSIRFGGKYRRQGQTRNRTLAQPGAGLRDGGNPFALGVGSFGGVPTPDDFLSGGFEDGVDAFLVPDPSVIDDLISTGFGDGDVFVEVPDDIANFTIDEDIFSAFGQINFDIEAGIRGNIGLRAIRVNRDSQALEIINGVTTPFAQRDSLTEFLPSVNIAFDVTEDFVFRTAASRTLALPTFTDLAPVLLNFNDITNTGNGGNPDLDPFVTDNFEVSFEYYHGEGNAVSLGLFYKDIGSFVVLGTDVRQVNGEDVLVSLPTNGGGGEVSGVEFAVLENFTFLNGFWSNFGVQANYTYSDSETTTTDPVTGIDLQLPSLSRHTANASLFYDDGKWSSRLAWTYRTGFFVGIQNNNAIFSNQARRFDYNLNYNITEKLSVFVEGLNLTDENTNGGFAGTPERITTQGRFGRRYFAGVNYRF